MAFLLVHCVVELRKIAEIYMLVTHQISNL